MKTQDLEQGSSKPLSDKMILLAFIFGALLLFGNLLKETFGCPPPCPPCNHWDDQLNKCVGCDPSWCEQACINDERCAGSPWPCCLTCGGDPNKHCCPIYHNCCKNTVEGCCNGRCYDTATQTCCGGQIKTKDVCKECRNGAWVDKCDWFETCCPETGNCCNMFWCEKTCINGECQPCGGNPKKCCDVGTCKDCCYTWNNFTCEVHNFDCGCDEIGSSTCTDYTKEWTIGTTNSCSSECTGGPPCSDYTYVKVPCFSTQGCIEGSWSYDSFCAFPEEGCISVYYFLLCQHCAANGPATVVKADDCQCL